MSENILQKIINKKKSRLVDLKIKRPIASLLEHPSDTISYYNFKHLKTSDIVKPSQINQH